MKNISVILARKYIASFYDILKMSFDEKTLKELKKKVEKYEDTLYIKEIINHEIKKNISDRYTANKEDNIARYQEMIKRIDEFYNQYFNGKEISDIKLVNKEIALLQKDLEDVTKEEYLIDITPLLDLKNNLAVELKTYADKKKNDEYIDTALFEQTISNIFNETKKLLNQLIKDNEIEPNEYVDQYIEHVYLVYGEVFASGSNKTNSMPNWLKGLLFCAPWIVGFAVFTLYPLIQTFIFSFSKVDLSPSGFVTSPNGFNNYINIFTKDTDFILALKNYLVTMVVYVPLITIFSLILAMLLNTKIKSKGFFRTIFFFPVIITSGPVIKILMEQGVTAMSGVNTLVDVQSLTSKMPELVAIAFNILTNEFIMILWFSGIQILVFVTALQKIDKGVYEASAIDGANKWEQFWKVTLPALNPTIIINVVFTVVMQSIFALNPIILKIQSDMNDTSEGKGYGYSAALAFTYFVIMIAVLVIFVLIFKRKNRRSKEGR